MNWFNRPLWGAPRWAWALGAAASLATWGLLGGGPGLIAGGLSLSALVARALGSRPEVTSITEARDRADEARQTRIAEQAAERGEVLRSSARSDLERVEKLDEDALDRELEETRTRPRR